MNMRLKQARAGFKQIINDNRQSMSILIPTNPVYPKLGGVTKTFTGRIAHERSTISELSETPAGISTNLQRFIQVEHTVDFLAAGQIVTDQNSSKWKLGPVDPLSKFGGIHGYQAPLTDAT